MKSTLKPFHTRGFVSLLMAFSFFGLAISGIVMYIAPPCSLAERTGWTLIALSKEQWASLHNVSALFILVLAIIHLFVFNWKTFMCYLRNLSSKRQAEREMTGNDSGKTAIRIPRELIAALIIAVVMYAGAISLIAPFGWLHDGSDAIKDYYRKEMSTAPGRGHDAENHEETGVEQIEIIPEGRQGGRGPGGGRSGFPPLLIPLRAIL